MKVLVYHGYELSSPRRSGRSCPTRFSSRIRSGRITPGWYRHPEQARFSGSATTASGPTAGGRHRRARARGFDGLYLDGTIEPWACCNERHGCGYRAADGSLHPTYPIFGVRRLMQRLYAMFHPGGLISAHQSTCCATPTLAWADSYWDGEQFAGGELSGDPLKKLPLGAFRAEFMGRNFGVPCEFLAYERPPEWTFDHALAVSLLHDVRVRPCGLAALERMSPIWNVMTRFGVSQAEWHPYWEANPLASAAPDEVKVSLYLHPKSAEPSGRALLVVSNLSPSEAVAAKLALDLGRMGLAAPAATDALSGESLDCAGGRLTVPLQPMRMRLVRLK